MKGKSKEDNINKWLQLLNELLTFVDYVSFCTHYGYNW